MWGHYGLLGPGRPRKTMVCPASASVAGIRASMPALGWGLRTDGDLFAFSLLFGYWDPDLQYSVFEFRLGFVCLGAFRQWNHPVETAVRPLRPMKTALIGLALAPFFTFDDD